MVCWMEMEATGLTLYSRRSVAAVAWKHFYKHRLSVRASFIVFPLFHTYRYITIYYFEYKYRLFCSQWLVCYRFEFVVRCMCLVLASGNTVWVMLKLFEVFFSFLMCVVLHVTLFTCFARFWLVKDGSIIFAYIVVATCNSLLCMVKRCKSV